MKNRIDCCCETLYSADQAAAYRGFSLSASLKQAAASSNLPCFCSARPKL